MSNLPKIDYPITNINVPSLKANFKFRPFLVKEEKILLMARESDNAADILIAIKQIINNCAIDKKLDINKLSLFDLEYIFLKIRAISVDNKVKVGFKDTEDGKIYDFEVDLNKEIVRNIAERDNYYFDIGILNTQGELTELDIKVVFLYFHLNSAISEYIQMCVLSFLLVLWIHW